MSTQPGQTLSHYRLVEKIGEGGMGVVWKAEDTVLNRTVAIKVLPVDVSRDETRREMFLQEAQLAAQVGDAHIVQVHEFGREGDLDFIVMEFIEGNALNKMLHGRPLPPHKVADFGHQIARALSKAHRKQLLHRDLKPANILVTPDGEAKVVDFGLATLFAASSYSQASTRTTEQPPPERKLAGTLSYMSPEQARMEQLDGRSDVFSLGSILYEMTTGQLPFTGPTSVEVLQAVQQARPQPVHDLVPQVPLELDRIIQKAMAPRQRDRYQSMEDLAVDLSRLGRELESGSSPSYEDLAKTAAPQRRPQRLFVGVVGALALLAILVAVWRFWPNGPAPGPADSSGESLAVLPFSFAPDDSDLEYLGDGIAESLIGRLARVPNLRVMARGTAFRFKNSAMDALGIGRELGVDTVLSGRVERHDASLVFRAELVRVADGAALWADRYAHEHGDILRTEDEIAQAIAEALRLQLSAEQANRLTQRATENAEAYRLYLKGRHVLHQFTYNQDVKTALDFFEQAIQKDPAFALAYIGVATCHTLGGGEYLGLPTKQAYAVAKVAGARALEIDPSLAEAHTLLGVIRGAYEWQWGRAAEEYNRAIELNPGSADAHHLYSQHLTTMGRHEEAIGAIKRALELDPLSLRISANLGGWTLYHARRYDEGIAQVRHTLDLDPDYGKARWYLGRLYLRKGMFEEAIEEFERLGSSWVGVAFAGLGRDLEAREQAKLIVRRQRGSSEKPLIAYEGEALAAIYMALGDHDKAFQLLERGMEQRGEHIIYLKVEPLWDPLRSDPRFDELLDQLGLPTN